MTAKRRAPGPAVKKSPAKTSVKRPGTTKRRILKGLLWLTVLGLVGALAGVGALVYVYQQTEIPDPNKDFLTQTTKVYYSGGKTEIGTFATQQRESIPLEEMPQTLQDAVISAEDRTFWTNQGIDPKGIIRAAFNNAKGGPTQGASTITQQYVKILYLTTERSLERKIKEAMVSLKLQRQQSKEEILEGYLNTIYFGRGAYGVEAAAQAFFDVKAKQLDLAQSAVLASVLNNPTTFDPKNGKDNKRALRERYEYVLNGMAEMGAISQENADRTAGRLPKFPKIAAESKYGGQDGFMLKLVRDELLELGYTDRQIDGEGLRVTTTFTPEAMAAAQQGVLAQRPSTALDGSKITDKELHVAAATVEPGTGALRGFFGGQDYLDSQINWAVAGGMAGSTMKAPALVAAIRDGFSLKDTFEGNSPLVLPDGLEFENQGDSDYGSRISMVTATENSVNTAFIDMVDSMENGPQKVVDAARDLGIPGVDGDKFGIPRRTIDLEPILGVPLGTAQVSPINLANAYATIAAGGERAAVHVIEKVESRAGEVEYQFKSSTKRTVDEDVAADVSYALQQVVEQGSGSAALALGRPVAGKTGTATNDDGDVSSSWFVGYTPQLSTAVMYARGKGRGALDGWLPEYFGGSFPARTWAAVMTPLVADLPVEDFPPPAYVDGEAPTDGHEPYTPPPPPPKPSRTKPPKETPTATPSPTQEPSPTDTGGPSPTDTGGPSPTDTGGPSPTGSPTASASLAPPAGRRGPVLAVPRLW